MDHLMPIVIKPFQPISVKDVVVHRTPVRRGLTSGEKMVRLFQERLPFELFKELIELFPQDLVVASAPQVGEFYLSLVNN